MIETVGAFILLGIAVAAFMWFAVFLFKGIFRAFTRCWWLAVILLVILPGVLIGWAIGEMLFVDEEMTLVSKHKE